MCEEREREREREREMEDNEDEFVDAEVDGMDADAGGGGGGGGGGGVDVMALPRVGTEVFVGGIEKDTNETELREIFEDAGPVHEIRVPKEPQNPTQNRGFAFIVYESVESARQVVQDSTSTEIRLKNGIRPLRVELSAAKNRLFVGNLPRREPHEAIARFFKNFSVGCESVECPPKDDGAGNKGFAFLDYYNHAAAELAKGKIMASGFTMQGDLGEYSHKLSVSIAEPKRAPQTHNNTDRERGDRGGGNGWNNDAYTSTPMSIANERGVRTIYVRNLSPAVTEMMLIDLFRMYGEIEEVYLPPPREGKPRNFGFVHFYHRHAADAAVSDRMQRKLDGKVIDVDLAKNDGAANGEAPGRTGDDSFGGERGSGGSYRRGGASHAGYDPAVITGDTIIPNSLLRQVVMPDGGVGFVLADPTMTLHIQSSHGAPPSLDTHNRHHYSSGGASHGRGGAQRPNSRPDKDGYAHRSSTSQNARFSRRERPY